MKRLIALTFAAIASICMLTACGNNKSQVSENLVNDTIQRTSQDTEAVTETDEIADSENSSTIDLSDNNVTSESEGKTLIAYFSRVGNTDFADNIDAVTSASLNKSGGNIVGNAQILAGFAQEITNGNVFLIETENKYPSEYRDTTNVAKKELNAEARPALISSVENFESYDNIVLIYPNWWGTIPMPVATFLESYDFTGKTILPICTHEGSAMGSSENDIKEILPNADVVDGFDVRGGSVSGAKSDVENYLNGYLQ